MTAFGFVGSIRFFVVVLLMLFAALFYVQQCDRSLGNDLFDSSAKEIVIEGDSAIFPVGFVASWC